MLSQRCCLRFLSAKFALATFVYRIILVLTTTLCAGFSASHCLGALLATISLHYVVELKWCRRQRRRRQNTCTHLESKFICCLSIVPVHGPSSGVLHPCSGGICSSAGVQHQGLGAATANEGHAAPTYHGFLQPQVCGKVEAHPRNCE
jgi:hypothetical protein